jgi:hypothetical protein
MCPVFYVIEPIQDDGNEGMKDGKEITFPPFCCAGFALSWEIRFLLVAASGKVETTGKFWTVP